MSKGIKILLWVLAILAILALLIYFFAIPWFTKIWDNITFSTPYPQDLNLNGLTLNDLANIAFTGQTKEVNARIGMDIKNENDFAIPFSKVKATLLYNDQVIAETSDNASHLVPANGTFAFSNVVNILLNNAGGQLLIDKLSGKTPVIDYVVNANVYGIPLPSIKNSFPW